MATGDTAGRIRKCRKKMGLTMKELAAKVGISEGMISYYESGERQPNYEKLIRLAEIFNCSTDYLLGIIDQPFQANTDQLKTMGVESIDSDELLTPEELVIVAEFIKKFKKFRER